MADDHTTSRNQGDVTVRVARGDDLGALQDLFARFYREAGFDAAAIAAIPKTLPAILQRPDTDVFVGLLDGAIVGAAAASTAFGLEVGLYAELEDLYVLSPARNKGVARALVDAVKDWAQRRGCHDLEVVLTPEAQANRRLVDWYSGQGFASTGRVILEYPLSSPTGSDATAPAKTISNGLPTPGISIGGVDGCKAGWVMVRRDGEGRFDPPAVAPALAALPPTDFVVIDIPIGLPDSGRRMCDRAARALLGPRRNSVFTGVRRPLLSFNDYPAANAWGKRDGAGLTKQMWHILPKIRDADHWITPDRQARIREGHPELTFTAAGGQPMSHYKKSPEGEAERIAALDDFIDPGIVYGWLATARGTGAARDDLVDAAGLCWTAARVALGLHRTVPEVTETDARGLMMEMVY